MPSPKLPEVSGHDLLNQITKTVSSPHQFENWFAMTVIVDCLLRSTKSHSSVRFWTGNARLCEENTSFLTPNS